MYNYDNKFAKLSKEYWLVETKTPNGYIELKDPFKVTVTKDSYDVKISKMPSIENTKKEGKFEVTLIKTDAKGNS